MNEIKVIYEDNEILILDKPAGITVNKSETTAGEETVQDWVSKNFKFPISNFQSTNVIDQTSDFFKRAGIVHRIDKETSGILIVAKTAGSFANLQAQFKERNVDKTYTALVHGKIDSPDGEIAVPIGRLPWSRKKFGVLAGGKDAVTKYRVISNLKFKISNKGYEPLTLLELNPKTGRTHQIRVHLKYLNHPVFSDFLYAGRKTSRDDRKILNRVFLHAQKISFNHPVTGKRVEFKSELAQELKNVISNLS